MERETLEALIAEGLTIEQIAARLRVSSTSVRNALHRLGLKTERARARAVAEAGGARMERVCRTHGRTLFLRRGDGGWRCLRCRSEAVGRRRRAMKSLLIAEAGGGCALCGYDRHPAALHFHHVDPTGKAFALSELGVTRSLARARDEALKCVLLCANCHAEVEAGVATLPT